MHEDFQASTHLVAIADLAIHVDIHSIPPWFTTLVDTQALFFTLGFFCEEENHRMNLTVAL
jgi:hypothetical protein